MKWIRTVVTVVIMIVSVGVIALGINNLTKTQVKEEIVTFEVLTENTVTNGTYSKIEEYVIQDNGYATNLKSLKLNSTPLSNPILLYDEYLYTIAISNSSDIDFYLEDDDRIMSDGYDIQIGDTFEITFEVSQPPILTGTIAIILGLIPLIIASSVLYFMLRKNNLGD